jgi:amino acid transporter
MSVLDSRVTAERAVDESLRVAPVDQGLRKGVIGLVSSFMTAMASTGPALVLATVVGAVVATVGVHSVGIMLLAAVPMLMVARSFWELDVTERDCGTTFVWVGRSLGPSAGFMSAWGQLGASLMIVPASAFVLAQYGFTLFRLDSLTESVFWTVVVGLVIIAALGAICYLGVELAARVQRFLLIAELLLVGIVVVVALGKVLSGDALAGANDVSASWFNPFEGGSISDALVIAIFAYWGWDIAFTLGEESRGGETPGRASVMSIVALVVLYVLGLVLFLAYAGTDFIGENADVLLAAIGESVLDSGLATTLITLAVLTSALAATQATFVSGSRLLLSMGAYKALPGWFARTNTHQAPLATMAMVGVGAVVFTVMAALSTTVLIDSLTATGMLICFYYGLTVFACAWRFRATLRHSARNLIWRGVVPVVAGLVLVYVLIKSATDYVKPENSGASFLGVGEVFWLAVGYLAIGVVLLVFVRAGRREYMSGATMRAQSTAPATAADGIGDPSVAPGTL